MFSKPWHCQNLHTFVASPIYALLLDKFVRMPGLGDGGGGGGGVVVVGGQTNSGTVRVLGTFGPSIQAREIIDFRPF